MTTTKKKRPGRKPTGSGDIFPARIRTDLIERIRQKAAVENRTLRATAEIVIEIGLSAEK